ncbi:hypothetical protein GCM10009755_11980 [Brevibacterium samyangense]|uniref:PucR C-terminal helix-turn-helix domain-containing protein n=1 Tax=Brevibacterium samyangense TaxID=366888 RepID=A0ABN2TBF6_9MICO
MLIAGEDPLEIAHDGYRLTGGVSEPFTSLTQVRTMLRTADVALEMARHRTSSSSIVHVDWMRPHEWATARLSANGDQVIAKRFIRRLELDNETLTTMQTHFSHEMDVAATAQKLNVHENTVRYRLKKLEVALGSSIHDARTVADIVLALKLSL